MAGSEPSGASDIWRQGTPRFRSFRGHGPVPFWRHLEERPAPGGEEHDLLVTVDANPHSALVNRPMMHFTEQKHILEAGLTSIRPMFDMVRVG